VTSHSAAKCLQYSITIPDKFKIITEYHCFFQKKLFEVFFPSVLHIVCSIDLTTVKDFIILTALHAYLVTFSVTASVQ